MDLKLLDMYKNSFKLHHVNFLLVFFLIISQNKICAQLNILGNELILKKPWMIQSSDKIKDNGSLISSERYSAKDWYPATVPSTVMGTLVNDKVYKDIFLGDNLKNILSKQFEVPWWYRTEFTISKNIKWKFAKLKFDGIIYRANIWLNGKQIANADSTEGVYRRFAFDMTNLIKREGKNILAVEIFPPKPGEPSIGFVDWNPTPPDKSMGIWRDVKIKFSGDVSINYPFVQSKINLKTLKSAELTVSTELFNNSNKNISGELSGEIGKIKFSKNITLTPNEKRKVAFCQEDYPQLKIKNPRLWWTYNFGKPELYKLKLSFNIGGKISDKSETTFGIREVSDYINKEGNRGYKLNGKKIQILGGGWVDNIFLNNNYKNLKSQIAYVKEMGLNTLRLEGIWGTSQDLYNLCDENGILIMLGLSCQWEWDIYIGKPVDEFGGIQTPNEMNLISNSWKDQIKWLRNHPSIFLWLYGSDKIPRPELEKNYLQILNEFHPSCCHLAAAKQMTSEVSGQTGVKMKGPYDYVTPAYWWTDKQNGGAVGFNTEIGPGVEIPPIESIKRMIPENHLWPIDSVWYFHCGKNDFGNLENYNNALFNRLGKPNDLEEYCTKAQYQNYEGTRAMFEANTANKYQATGVIYWMLNSAWPKLWWQLYDYYLMPGGAFYGTKKALEPLHILYDYANNNIIAVNSTFQKQVNLTAKIQVLNFDLSKKFMKDISFELPSERKEDLLKLPTIDNLSRTYFVDLKLLQNNKLVSSNFYCLSTKHDELDTAKTTWILTPTKEYSDLTELNNLGKVHLSIKEKIITKNKSSEVEVELVNNSNKLAFQVVLSVHKGKNRESILPVSWDDNYFSLLPGEKRKIKGYFSNEELEGAKPFIKVSGWNVD